MRDTGHHDCQFRLIYYILSQVLNLELIDIPDLLIIHWDSKLIMPIMHQTYHETGDDQLAVIFPFPSIGENHKFLAAPRITDSTGESITQNLLSVLRDSEIPNGDLEIDFNKM